jgi:hypothetical protein
MRCERRGANLDRGPDSDALQWWGSDPVEIDLSAGVLVGDATKELVSIYSALGGNGNDTILGSDGPNFLDSLAGKTQRGSWTIVSGTGIRGTRRKREKRGRVRLEPKFASSRVADPDRHVLEIHAHSHAPVFGNDA